ncbi:MAG: DUF86 domain-containing protein [Prevotellaceae bacterium]|jgi:uncharacterized protein with HEPN domain|nr:DUF86 domain-containing protein [Prevotellaceae bacterium]
MYDKPLILEEVQRVETSLQDLQKWTSHITSPDDFLLSMEGMILLNAVCMKLFAIGEEVKTIDKHTNKALLPLYPAIMWKDIMGMRDVIAHHYFELDAPKVTDTLQNDIQPLLTVIQQIKKDLSK